MAKKLSADQKTFNKAYHGILKQGAIAYKKEHGCKYYIKETRHRCAIGVCVPVGVAKEADLLGVNSLQTETARQFFEPYFPDVRMRLLQEIQIAHDSCRPNLSSRPYQDPMQMFKGNMKKVAAHFSLTIPSD